DVEVRVEPQHSLLFPESFGLAGGRGIFTVSDGLEFTIDQRIAADAGGDRNHLGRPIGRTLSFALQRTSQGDWEGDFEEKVYGLFEQPVSLQGTALLSRASSEPTMTFDLGQPREMPGHIPSELPDPSSFFVWTCCSCQFVARQATNCSDLNSAGCLGCVLVATYYQPFFASLNANLETTRPFDVLRSCCS